LIEHRSRESFQRITKIYKVHQVKCKTKRVRNKKDPFDDVLVNGVIFQTQRKHLKQYINRIDIKQGLQSAHQHTHHHHHQLLRLDHREKFDIDQVKSESE